MANRLTKLVLGVGSLSLGLVGFDLSKGKGEALETISILGSESLAFGCGVVSYNHHRKVDTVTLCYSGGTFIQVTTGHDCVVSDQECCTFPNTGSCPGFAG